MAGSPDSPERMQFREKQIAPPKSWELFESLCHALFVEVWRDQYAVMHGRRGQAQFGVDIYGSPGRDRGAFHGIQCKGKDRGYGAKATLGEVKAEILNAEGFAPGLEHWVFVTSAPRDAQLQKAGRQISKDRSALGKFTVSILGWEDIQALLAKHPNVIREFYPEHGYDIRALCEHLLAIVEGDASRELMSYVATSRGEGRDAQAWRTVLFEGTRDLGPALLGRSLGPTDALATPRLREADSVTTQLRQAYSARLVGEAGAGKSVCAYQVAHDFFQQGWTVSRLVTPPRSATQLSMPRVEGPTLLLVDDAHLLPPHELEALEDEAGPRSMVVSTHTVVGRSASHRGAVYLDSEAAVHTIASALRAAPDATLETVRRVDDHVGKRQIDTSLEDRLEHAEELASSPWQFCFILGGGWRRARDAASAARFAGADITLATVAIHPSPLGAPRRNQSSSRVQGSACVRRGPARARDDRFSGVRVVPLSCAVHLRDHRVRRAHAARLNAPPRARARSGRVPRCPDSLRTPAPSRSAATNRSRGSRSRPVAVARESRAPGACGRRSTP